MSITFLDPTHENDFGGFLLAPRLESVKGITLGIISNGKRNTASFFDAFESALRKRYGVGDVIRVTKGNYSAPAEPDIISQSEHWQALVAGVGD
ncbi:MAG: hypothetical protein OXC54_10030 [Rhodospirillaceae bacterium]|nr:hypothetical protein [Rhodospirillaceae bacterium]MCY4311629.1 hypothetical protein [Rhodospirillaceae bacterium]